jgi:hypothetical protein
MTPDERLERVRATVPDYAKYVLQTANPVDQPHVLVACMPKSGSTWLTSVLARLPGLSEVALVPGWGRREQELSELRLILGHQRAYVSQMHLRWSEPTGRLLSYFGVRPVVLVRDLHDVIPSLRDHFRYEGVDGSFAYVPADIGRWSDDRIEDFLVDLVVPWYLNFYVSWLDCPDPRLVRYEDLMFDMFGVVRGICGYAGVAASDAQIRDAMWAASQAPTRKNVGGTGRGAALSARSRSHIARLASYYPGVDFSPIGIGASEQGAQGERALSAETSARIPRQPVGGAGTA